MEKLLLIDGNAIVHRAYHALPPLHVFEGKPTNAVYGFFAMVLKVINDLKPDYIVVCFDRAAPTFRKQMYVGYQAQRPQMADELSAQFALLHDVLEKAKFKLFEVDGYEADDMIGTIANQAVKSSKDTQVVILSGDRDLLQLVNGNVKMIAPITGVTKMNIFDKKAVVEKYGLEPHQIPDYKALVGDPSDNYPGVTGVGPKTASLLISKFKDLENLYKNLSEVPQKVSEKLATDAEQAALAKKLATIEVNAPIKFIDRDCKASDIDEKSLLKSFKMLKFRSLIERFGLEKVEEITQIKEEPSQKKEKEESDQMSLL
jgi:DNA polymerase I